MDPARPQNRWPELQVVGVEDRVVVVGPRGEPLDEVRERLDAKPAGEVVVERRDRLAVEDGVVGEAGPGRDGPTTGDLDVEPGRGGGVERRGQSPRRAGGCVALSDMGESHGRSVRSGHGDVVSAEY